MIRHAEILRALLAHGVRFVVVGGSAAVLQGAPIQTLDVDVVYDRADDNVGALGRALVELEAVFRTDPRRIPPNESHLRSPGHKLLVTKFGVLDVLATIEETTEYAQLEPHIEEIAVGDLRVPVLSLERLIEVKRKLTRPKDRLMLMQLEATLDEKRRARE